MPESTFNSVYFLHFIVLSDAIYLSHIKGVNQRQHFYDIKQKKKRRQPKIALLRYRFCVESLF